jgi:hypothetical protein
VTFWEIKNIQKHYFGSKICIFIFEILYFIDMFRFSILKKNLGFEKFCLRAGLRIFDVFKIFLEYLKETKENLFLFVLLKTKKHVAKFYNKKKTLFLSHLLIFYNGYLCSKLGNSIFFRIRHGIFDRDDSRDQKHAVCILLIISKLKSEIKIVLLSLP